MAWITPVTNWKTTDKINIADFNRVENNTEFLKDLLNNSFGKSITQTHNTTWTNTQVPYFDELNRIEDNIKVLNDNWSEPAGWITPITDWVTGPIVRTNNASGAELMNRIEKDLLLLYNSINGTSEYLLVTGTFTTGNNSNRQRFGRS